MPKGGGQNYIWGKFVPVPACAGAEGVASVVCAAAEALVLEAVVAILLPLAGWSLRSGHLPHTRLTSGDLVQHGEAFLPSPSSTLLSRWGNITYDAYRVLSAWHVFVTNDVVVPACARVACLRARARVGVF